MIAALLAFVAVFSIVVLVLVHSHVATVLGQLRESRQAFTRAAETHHTAMKHLVTAHSEQVDNMARAHDQTVEALITNAQAERREAAQERTSLLNRIQDPVAGVAMSIAQLPSPGDLDVEFER